jgi:transposase
MTETLTPVGYEQTKEKLAQLEKRLARLAHRTDLSKQHQSEARRSYEQMISQYRREIKLYEAAHPESIANP